MACSPPPFCAPQHCADARVRWWNRSSRIRYPRPVRYTNNPTGTKDRALHSVHQLRNLADPDMSYRRPFPNQRPIFGCRKKYGMASPPEPANSLVIITFGPRIAALGVRLILPYRGDAHA
jgi:hypothetical protein